MDVSIIGTGAVGSAAASALLDAGHPVTVWNRTPARADALVGRGARRAPTVTEAVASAGLALLTLTDYAAVLDCLDRLDRLPTGHTVVVLCTGSPAEARAAAQRAAEHGLEHLDAGLQGSPDALGTNAATILYSGSRAAYERHRDVLGRLGRARFVGDAPDAAATWDLALLGLWYDAQVGVLRALATLRDAGADATAFVDAAETQLGHVVSGIERTAAELVSGDHPAGPASLVEHLPVVERLLDLRAHGDLGDGGLASVRRRISDLLAAGRGDEGLTAVAGRP